MTHRRRKPLLVDEDVQIVVGDAAEAPAKRARKVRTKTWMRLTIQGTEWRVLVVDPSHPDMPDCEGQCMCERGEILIRADLSHERRIDVLFHEMLHACVFSAGLDTLMAETLKVSSEAWGVHEERLVRLLNPVLMDTLRRNKLLRAIRRAS